MKKMLLAIAFVLALPACCGKECNKPDAKPAPKQQKMQKERVVKAPCKSMSCKK